MFDTVVVVTPIANRKLYDCLMTGPEDVTTAADLDAMTPAERHADFESRVVTDPSTLPDRYQERLRAQAERVLAREHRHAS
jgi:hypothetical protein